MADLKHIRNFATFSQMLKTQNEQKAFEEKSTAQREYADFFLNLLQQYDVSSPSELSDEKKKDFFDKIAKGWEPGEGQTSAGDKMVGESFVNEANDSKILTTAFKEVVNGLNNELKKESDKDLIKTYKNDIRDYEKLINLAKTNTKKAIDKWERLDTVSREYLADYVNKKSLKELGDVLGVDIKESVITINERNAFLGALMAAKKESKTSFEFKGKVYEVKVKNAPISSIINEEEVSSDDEFKEYAKEILKKAHGDQYDDAKAEETIKGLLADRGESSYGELVGKLQSSLG